MSWYSKRKLWMKKKRIFKSRRKSDQITSFSWRQLVSQAAPLSTRINLEQSYELGFQISSNTDLDCGLSAGCCRRSESSWLGLSWLHNIIGAGSVKDKGRQVLIARQIYLQWLTVFKSTPFARHNAAKRRCTPEFEANVWKHVLSTSFIAAKSIVFSIEPFLKTSWRSW